MSPLLQRFGHHGDHYQAKVISKNNFTYKIIECLKKAILEENYNQSSEVTIFKDEIFRDLTTIF